MFEVVGSLPLQNPHDGYEGVLLARGLKPIGLLAEMGAPGEPSYLCDEEFKAQTEEQIRIADEAVAAGKIKKHTIIVPPPNFSSDEHTLFGHFYSQPEYEEEMRAFAEWHFLLWKDNKMPSDLPKDSGEYFGYTAADLTYGTQNPVVLFVLDKTNDLRRYCRMQALLSKPQGPRLS
jgi:hypothetical protein